MKINRYAVHLTHDSGHETLIIFATSKNAAKKIVMNTERCPERAIRKIVKF